MIKVPSQTVIGNQPRLFVMAVLGTTLLAGLSGCGSQVSDDGSASSVTDITVPPTVTTTRPPPNVPSSSTTTTTTLPPTTTTTTVLWDLPDPYVDQVEALIGTVESLRGRSFLFRPWVGRVSIEEMVAGGIEAAPLDERDYMKDFFELLGMLASGTDWETLYSALEDSFVRPIYAPPEGVLIPDRSLPLDEYGSLLLVGELTKALAHQHHPDSYHPEVDLDLDGGDQALARRALHEGEAVLVQTLYLESLGEDRTALIYEQAAAATDPGSDPDLSALANVPRLAVEERVFPGQDGANLAFDLYRRGGFAALDQAFERPPDTTEQVLHLEKYRAQEPAARPNPFRVVLEGYETVEDGTWGELRWRGLFSHHGDPVSAARSAEGWGGDLYQLLWEPDSRNLVFAARLTADSFQDESEYNAAIRNLVREGMDVGDSRVIDTTTEWVGADYAMLSWDIGVLTLVVASDTEAGQLAAAQLGINLQ
ncbi:MAG: hypothetical protein OXG89_02805 [bacterium]|nr:hypothetical protein [bacterium]